MASTLEAAAICTPGLEPVLTAELDALGQRPKFESPGVVRFRPKLRDLYAANVNLRTASRVLLRLGTFRATDFPHLEERAREIDWSEFLADGIAPTFKVSTSKSALYHSEAIAERLHNVVGPPPRDDQPTQPFIVRFFNDVAYVSVDSSGLPLNHRPWREDIGVAPIRPTMATAMLLGSGWDGTTSMGDPFCGSGTIAIEAALIARGMAPGGDREFAFQHWETFQPGTWGSVKGAAAAMVKPLGDIMIEATDHNAEAVEITKANAERAGVLDDMTIEQRVVSHLSPHDGPGLIATNPPYGKRVGEGDLRALYLKFGAVVRERRPKWGVTMVASDTKLARHAEPSLKPISSFGHGGIKVQVLHRPPLPQ